MFYSFQEVADDWAFQVLHKRELKRQNDYSEFWKINQERKKIQEEEELKKTKQLLDIHNAINERQEQERLAIERRQETKRKQEREFVEENEMSGRIVAAMNEDKQLFNIQRESTKSFMKTILQHQIQNNKVSSDRKKKEKEEKEWNERNKLINLLDAEKQQMIYQKNEMFDDITNFKLGKKNFKSILDNTEKTDDYAFLDEGWQLDDQKIRNEDHEHIRGKQLNASTFNAIQNQMAEHDSEKKKAKETEHLEIQDRLVWEKEHKNLLAVEKSKEQQKKETYRRAVEEQLRSNCIKKEILKLTEEEECAKMLNRWKMMNEVDEKEAANPIDSWHPSRQKNSK